MDDYFYTNSHYARVGGVAVSELNCLELDFLERVNWRCIPGRPDTAPLQADTQFPLDSRPLRYAHDVLGVYYAQLIDLTGKADPAAHYVLQDDEISEDEDYDEEEEDFVAPVPVAAASQHILKKPRYPHETST